MAIAREVDYNASFLENYTLLTILLSAVMEPDSA